MSIFGTMAGLAGIQGAVGAITGGFSARKQYKYQSQLMDQQQGNQIALMDKQNQQQTDFWNMNNAYNTPDAQRQRLESAGLNPDMMYGNGGNMVSSQTPQAASGNAASGQAPKVDYGTPNIMGAYQMSLQAQMMQAQVEKIGWENELLKERAKTEANTRELNSSLTNLRTIEGKYLPESLETQNRLRWSEEKNKGLQGALIGAELGTYTDRFNMDQQRLQNDNMRLKIQLSQLGLNSKKVDSDINMANMAIDKIVQETSNLSTQQKLIYEQFLQNKFLNYYYNSEGVLPNGGLGSLIQYIMRFTYGK